MIADHVLAEVAQICRQVYIDERNRFARDIERKANFRYRPGPRWDGGEDANGTVHKPAWPKIAAFMMKHHLEPYGAIRMRFQMSANSKRFCTPPMPNQIALVKYLDDYTNKDNGVDFQACDLEASRESEVTCCRMNMTKYQLYSGMSPDEACAMVLLDEQLPISPLMRYCVAFSAKVEDIAKQYYGAAATQYMMAPNEYDAAWAAFLPESFTCTVRASYQLTGG